MKKIISIFVSTIFIFILTSNTASASTLNCSQVDGMAIFGYDGTEWIHIGAIGNEFNTLSIANEFGAGSEFKSTSILNEFGKYGSEFSSNSAFNDFAGKPPIIVSNNYKFIGYLTINEFRTPNINPYEAISCSKKSFISPKSDMKDITFKDIPSSASYTVVYSDPPSQTPPPIAVSCPVNSNYINSQCACNDGYVMSGGMCLTYNQSCRNGNNNDINIIGTKGSDGKISCSCISGYSWNGYQCIFKPPVISPPIVTTSCPQNSILINSSCVCNSGYTPNGNQCIPNPTPDDNRSAEIEKNTKICQEKLGEFGTTLGVLKSNGEPYCGCSYGYVLSNDLLSCTPIKTESINLFDGIKVSDKTANQEFEPYIPVPKKVEMSEKGKKLQEFTPISQLLAEKTSKITPYQYPVIEESSTTEKKPIKLSLINRIWKFIWRF